MLARSSATGPGPPPPPPPPPSPPPPPPPQEAVRTSAAAATQGRRRRALEAIPVSVGLRRDKNDRRRPRRPRPNLARRARSVDENSAAPGARARAGQRTVNTTFPDETSPPGATSVNVRGPRAAPGSTVIR